MNDFLIEGMHHMIVVLILGWAVLYADRTALYPLLSVIAETLGISSAQAVPSPAHTSLLRPPADPQRTRRGQVGTKRVLLFMFALSARYQGSASSGTRSPAPSFSALHGLGAGAYYPCCFGTILATVPPEKRGISSGFIGMGMALGILGGMA